MENKKTKESHSKESITNITIVTGASSGLGKEFARQLFVSMHKDCSSMQELWLLSRSKTNLEQLKQELLTLQQKLYSPSGTEQTFLPSIKFFSVDLSGTAGVESFKNILLQESQKQKITVKTLINNAGFGTYGTFEQTPLDKELNMIELNCISLTGITGICLPFLKEKSRIINVSSLAAFMPLGNFAVYAATKAYVLSFSVALAAELSSRKIYVSALCPGSVSTNFANIASNGARKEVLHGKDPVKVVSHCLKKSEKNKKIILWWPKWKITAFLSHFVPRYFVAKATFLFNKRPYKQ